MAKQAEQQIELKGLSYTCLNCIYRDFCKYKNKVEKTQLKLDKVDSSLKVSCSNKKGEVLNDKSKS